jgi:hypothetical protein
MRFADEIVSAFASTGRLSALKLRDVAEPQVFDNAYAELDGGAIRIRVLRERGQVFGRIGPAETPEWYDLDLALDAVGAGDAARQWNASGQTSLPQLARLIENHLDDFVAAFRANVYDQFRLRVRDAGRNPVFRPFARP